MSRLFCLVAVSAAIAAHAYALAGESVVLRPGEVDVVLPEKPVHVESLAAEELTNFLSRVLGAPVPVAAKAVEGRTAILLGRAAGFDVAGFERDAFRTKVERAAGGGATIRIAGRDGSGSIMKHVKRLGVSTRVERATLFGVYAFLEDFAGVRFYFPGELGVVANRREKLEVPVLDRTVAPWFPIRSTISSRDGVWYEPLPEGWHKHSGKAINLLRQRFGTWSIPCCHGQNGFKIVERFASTHPEYCQLRKDGTRCVKLERERIGDAPKQLCQSSAIWDVFHDDIVSSGRTGYVDVMPQDAYRACECKACQAAYRRNPDGTLADSYASELVWGKTAELARRFLAEGRKDLIFTQMSYGPYRELPNLDLPTNVLAMVAVSGPWGVHNPDVHGKALKRIKAWADKLGHRVWLWTYPHKFFTTVLPGVPDNGPRAWGKFFKDAAPYIIGAFCEGETDHWLFHYLSYYVFSRIAWDPSTDVDAVIDEHNRLMFGAGHAEMAKVLEMLEEKWVKGIAGRIVDTPVGPKSAPPCEHEIWMKLYSPAVMAEMERLMATAEEKAGAGTLEARRVDFIRREMYGPLKAAAAKYRSLMCDGDAERSRRAEMPAEGDVLKGAKWQPVGPVSKFDDSTFLSEPRSMKIFTNPKTRTGYFLARTKLEPSARYRLSYFVKCDNVVSLAKGGGVCATVRQGKIAGKEGKGWTFPPNGNFLAGTTDWIPQVFEFETDESWREQTETAVWLKIRYAVGTANFDDVRLDKVGAASETTTKEAGGK